MASIWEHKISGNDEKGVHKGTPVDIPNEVVVPAPKLVATPSDTSSPASTPTRHKSSTLSGTAAGMSAPMTVQVNVLKSASSYASTSTTASAAHGAAAREVLSPGGGNTKPARANSLRDRVQAFEKQASDGRLPSPYDNTATNTLPPSYASPYRAKSSNSLNPLSRNVSTNTNSSNTPAGTGVVLGVGLRPIQAESPARRASVTSSVDLARRVSSGAVSVDDAAGTEGGDVHAKMAKLTARVAQLERQMGVLMQRSSGVVSH